MAENETQETQQQSGDAGKVEAKRAERDENRLQVTADIRDVNSLSPEPGEDVGESQVQEIVDAQNEAGFRGIKVDPTPNENYSASNSSAQNDLPTPETDQELRAEAREARRLDGPESY